MRPTAAILRLARRGPFRPRELDALGVPRIYLSRMVQAGQLVAVGRGLYQLPTAEETELHSVAAVLKRTPHATACLLTALQIHGLTTEAPHAVWILIDAHARAPVVSGTALEIVRASGEARTHGVERRVAEGVELQVTSPAKTVADCFRYRRHVGLEVALAALRGFLGRRREGRAFGLEVLAAAAKADRVTSVLRPYLEALA